MTKKLEAKDRIVTALDVSSEEQAQALAEELGPHVGVLKLGLEFFTTFGPAAVRGIVRKARVFLDLKLNDIPNTVGKAAANCAATGAEFINVHATAGRKAIEAAVANRGNSSVLVVTILTSLQFSDLMELGLAESYLREDPDGLDNGEVQRLAAALERGHMQRLVLKMAKLAHACGAQGVICSPEEIAIIRKRLPPDFIVMTPGVRPSWYGAQDQKRIMTPREAIAAGADYLVIGRPITNPPDGTSSLEAVARIVDEIEQGIAERVVA